MAKSYTVYWRNPETRSMEALEGVQYQKRGSIRQVLRFSRSWLEVWPDRDPELMGMRLFRDVPR